MQKLFVLMFVMIAGRPAFAQVRHGTVAVIYYSDATDKIIMAADSRAIWDGQSTPDDRYCKIAAPQGKLLFVSSNSGGWKNGGITDVVPSWQNVEEIHRAYNIASSSHASNDGRVIGSAEDWGAMLTLNFRSLYQEHPEPVIEIAQKSGGVLTKAFIGGVGNTGQMILVKTTVTLQQGVVSYETHGVGCPNSFLSAGIRRRSRTGIH